jgi:hypothetical protein
MATTTVRPVAQERVSAFIRDLGFDPTDVVEVAVRSTTVVVLAYVRDPAGDVVLDGPHPRMRTYHLPVKR